MTQNVSQQDDGAYSVGVPLQQDVDGSVEVAITVVQSDHTLVLVLPCDVNQLRRERKTDVNRGTMRLNP